MKVIRVSHRYVFNRKNKLNSKGKALLQSEIRIGKDRKFYSTGIYLTPEQWDGKIIKHKDAYHLNRKLAKLRHELSELDIRNFGDVDSYFTGADPENFLEYYSAYIEKHPGAYSTYKQYNSTLSHLYRFSEIKYFTDLTPENIQKFTDYLYSVGLSHQTVYNVHKRVKTAIRRAYVAGKIDKNPYDMIKLKTPKSGEIRYLSESELKKVEDWQPDSKKLELVKDVFLFACYTGLSYSDLKAFSIEDGYIIDKRKKTGEGYIIYLTPKAKRILDKYDHLPLLSNQVTNRYLAEISYKAGVKKFTFHMARHTFAVDALNKGVPLEVVSRILGHSKISTTQVYAKVLKSTIAEHMKKL